MNVEVLSLPKEKAQREYEAWKQLLRKSKAEYAKDFLALYAHMKHGGKVIDLFEAMRMAGLNEDGDPRLAIVRADAPRVEFCKDYIWQNNVLVSDGGTFYPGGNDYGWRKIAKLKTKIPRECFPEWRKDAQGRIIRQRVQTVTPVIPARILNPLRSYKLENYHILWEVPKWNAVPKDPILLKRITSNMFLVLATWNLTKLERAVIRGRIQ